MALSENFTADGSVSAPPSPIMNVSPASCISTPGAGGEPPRQDVLRRLNLAPGNTLGLVKMREDLLEAMMRIPPLRRWTGISCISSHRGSTGFSHGSPHRMVEPAHILEKIIRYEAVHEIRSGMICAAASIRPIGAATPSSTPRWRMSR